MTHNYRNRYLERIPDIYQIGRANFLNRFITFYGYPPAFAFFGPIVPDCAVHAATVLPECHVIQIPTETDLIINMLCMFEKHIKDCVTFAVRQPKDFGGKCAVYKKRFTTRVGVSSYNWMHCFGTINIYVSLSTITIATFINMF